MKKWLLTGIAAIQAALAIRVFVRMFRSIWGERIPRSPSIPSERIAIIVPVLNEFLRLAPCLEGLILHGDEVAEILVVDGGSTDGTQDLIHSFTQRDARVRLLDASPIPADWNGKAWGLQFALNATTPATPWILTVDADVYPTAPLASSLLYYAKQSKLDALSIATQQVLGTPGEGMLHPALLTTLVYRFGPPGKRFTTPREVQANGQCFLFHRPALLACDGFVRVRYSVCEDITIARILVQSGYAIGFYETRSLVSVKMYDSWRDVWQNWTRSLTAHDHFTGWHSLLSWCETFFVQAIPLPLFLLGLFTRNRNTLFLNIFLLMMRCGVLFGTSRAYINRPWTYWISPLCDIPAVAKIAAMTLQRQHVWRGRILVRRPTSS